MPTISQFYGIKINLFWEDHPPAHFHARYQEFEAQIDIRTGAILRGKLPPKARILTEEWRLMHINELLRCWELVIQSKAPFKIKGLE